MQLERQFSEPLSRYQDVWTAEGLVGNSIVINALRRRLEKAARVDTPILLTGKEVAANLIHRASRPAAGPFVAVNCAALPSSLIQAELFGHEKGASEFQLKAGVNDEANDNHYQIQN